ncbi:sulfate adenylyltransferase [Bacillus sp. JJ1521]|uniref:sulfate adenylyltransferase n=1 Tax=Bacillus sp. JJ1521 TaxID=3122957 RepID=UPI002FFDFD49
MAQLIPPHGHHLVNLELSSQEGAKYESRISQKSRIIIDSRVLSDLLLLATGVYSPLKGFMKQADYLSVLHNMCLSNGTIWSIPITLPVDWETADKLKEGEEIGLMDESNRLLAVLFLEEKYSYDKMTEAKLVYQTTDEKHPGVAKLLRQGSVLLGGEIRLIERPAVPFTKYHYDPSDMRKIISEKGWKSVVAFQTRNPIHRAHEYIQKCALELVDGLIIHPLVGQTKADDVPADVRIRSYETLIRNYYPNSRTLLAVFPAAMRYAGPREAIFHAICRKNYGCTHMIIGRDHAGVGDYYGTYDAQKLITSVSAKGLGITPLCFEHSFYCKACGSMASNKTCPHSDENRLILSGTKVRELLRSGKDLPPEFSRREVAEILRQAYSNKADSVEGNDIS